MKRLYVLSLLFLLPFFSKAQCFTQIQFTNIDCFGNCNGTAQAFPVGAAPYTYLWTPGGMTTQTVTGLCAGGYTVTVIDNAGCTSTSSCNITQPSQLFCAATVTQQASCSTCCDGSGVGTASGGTPPYTYMWAPAGCTGSTCNTLCPGTYSFCVTDANGCTCCSTVTVTFSTGISNPGLVSGFDAFPNPVTKELTITANFSAGTNATILVVNMLGEVVYTKNETATGLVTEHLDVSDFPSGAYFVQVKTEMGSTFKKVVKQ
ncbi:MAG TPA: T9SS type A sorting domain-containing protein [Bacteroidia bacterium]|jgi:hypothetical protein|nr:T9SS type A sorting domain-containing protein [Bacteroidia bacterium]